MLNLVLDSLLSPAASNFGLTYVAQKYMQNTSDITPISAEDRKTSLYPQKLYKNAPIIVPRNCPEFSPDPHINSTLLAVSSSELFAYAGTAGLLCGMGFLIYAAIFVLIMSLVLVLYSFIGFGEEDNSLRKSLRITVPENVDYTKEFEEIFDRYTTSRKLLSAKTSGMGSLFKLSYDITLKDPSVEKTLVDELRVKNGNLEIAVTVVMPRENEEL